MTRTEQTLTTARIATARRAPAARRAASNAAGAATRDRLLRAAERLVARSGVDGVSTREILVAARADSAAIHYHFGSKDALMAAVFTRRLPAIREGVERVLAAKAARGGPFSVRDVAEAIVMPLAEMAADRTGGGRHYLGFTVALLNYRPLAHLRTEGEPWFRVLLSAYETVSPTLSDIERRRRIGFGSHLAFAVLSDGPQHAWFQDRQMQGPGDMVEALLDFVTSGLTPNR
jgi:AcrR family transcriptional regulator